MSTLELLTAALSVRSDESLAALLRARSDLLNPPATDFAALAARSSSRASLSQALELLNAPELQTLTTLVVLEGADLPGLGSALGGATPAQLEPLLERLSFLGLVVLAEPVLPKNDAVAKRFLPLTSLREVLGAHPAGLGRSYRELAAIFPGVHVPALLQSETPNISELIKTLPEGAAAILSALTTHPLGVVGRHQGGPVDWLLSQGLLVALDETHVELPRELSLALKGGHVYKELQVKPPRIEYEESRADPLLSAESAGSVATLLRDNASVEAISACVRTMTSLLAAVRRTPLPTLRTGGVGVRPVRSLAKELDLEVSQLNFFLELAALAHLLVLDPDTSLWRASLANPAKGSAESPLGVADWASLDRAQQWLWLVAAWRDANRLPALVGTGSPEVTVLGAGTFRPEASAARISTLDLLDTIAESPEFEPSLPLTQSMILEYCAWYHPRLARRLPTILDGFLHEAQLLGLTGAGAFTMVGSMVARGDWAGALVTVAAILPAPVTELFLQGDLSAISPGYLEPALAAELTLISDPEGKGAAGIYRFSEASIGRALDAGRTAEDLLEFLTEHSAAALPQSLEYLIKDTASRHGRLTLGAAGTFLQASTAELQLEFLASDVASDLGFVALSPTVAATSSAPNVVSRALSKAQVHFATAKGQFSLVSGRTPRRTSPSDQASSEQQPPAALATLWVSDGEKASDDVVLQEGGTPEDPVMNHVRMLRTAPVASAGAGELRSAQALETLRQAMRTGTRVWLRTAGSDGTPVRVRVAPLELGSGRLRVRADDGVERTQSIHRIIDVELVEEQ